MAYQFSELNGMDAESMPHAHLAFNLHNYCMDAESMPHAHLDSAVATFVE